MESLQETSIFKFNPDTLESVRKEYGLDKPGMMNQSIDILEEWLKKQDHFVVKSYDRGYLERIIIFSKGSTEKAKKKIDKVCTYRTLLPHLFQHSFEEFFDKNDVFVGGFLPKLTEDNDRVFMIRSVSEKYERSFLDYYKLFLIIAEYAHAYDYFSQAIVIFDYRKANMNQMLLNLDLVDLQQTMAVLTEGYGLRVKRMHFVTSSDLINIMVGLIKPVFSDKISKRVFVHKNMEEVLELIEPKDILPVEYGGKAMSLNDIFERTFKATTSDDFAKYLKRMAKASTIEELRQKGKFNEEYLGMAGTFRSLCVD